jgi:hypothetical protein
MATVPFEDEEISEEEEQAVARSRDWFLHNPGTPFEDVAAELGFSMDQIRDCEDLISVEVIAGGFPRGRRPGR